MAKKKLQSKTVKKKANLKSPKKTVKSTVDNKIKVPKAKVSKVKQTRTAKADGSKQAPPEKCFFVVDGSVLSSLNDLRNAVKYWSDDVFYYHVTDSRNDLGNWVKDVFKIKKLANKLYEAKSINEVLKALDDYVK